MDKMKNRIKQIPWQVLPVIVVMAVIPLVVHYYEFDSKLNVMSWYVNDGTSGDLFNYYKGQLLEVMAGVMLACIVIGQVFSMKLSWHKAMIPLALYAVMAVISTLLSDYSYFSKHGIADHFETVYILLTYCLLVFFCYWFINSERAVKFILYFWFAGIALMCVIGLFQLAGHDLYATELGKWLLIPASMRETKDLQFHFDPGVVYMTLYNPNYVGFYATLTIPVLTVTFIFMKSRLVKAIALLLNSAVFLCLMGSGAKNGMVALLVALLVMLVLFRKKLWNRKVEFLIAYGSMIFLFFGFNVVNGGMVTERLESGFTVQESTGGNLKEIETNEDGVVIHYAGHSLKLQMDQTTVAEKGLLLMDEEGNPVTQEKAETGSDVICYEVMDERFPFQITIGKVGSFLGFGVEIEGKLWYFSNQTEYQGYYFYTPYGKFTKIEKAESVLFTNYPNLASGRGYLWARTIPLLKDYLLVGSGPDTFTVVFPQKDYVAASELGYDKLIVTKPHNLYLQIATQTGVLSLLAFLGYQLIYLVECLRMYWKKEAESYLEYIGVAIMIAVVGYLISGIINDSTITVAPIFWCLTGIGLAVNRMVKKQRLEKTTEKE